VKEKPKDFGNRESQKKFKKKNHNYHVDGSIVSFQFTTLLSK
jgi:hypothetical protein